MNDQPTTFGPAGWTPDHYRGNGMQPFDVINAFDLDFYEGNALKYLLRWRKKNGAEDLRKARTYVQILIDRAAQQTPATAIDDQSPAWLLAGTRDQSIPEQRCTCAGVGFGDGTCALHHPAMLVDEDVVRAARHDSLGVLLSRISNGLALTSDEAGLLLDHVDAEVRENTTARSVAAGNKRHVQAMYGDLQQAHARAEQAEAERDGAYRERAQLLALLATMADSAVLVPAVDIEDEDGWHLLFLNAAGRQMSWHIAPRDVELFRHVERVGVADPRAQWDGHTTDEKYAHIADWTAEQAQGGGVPA